MSKKDISSLLVYLGILIMLFGCFWLNNNNIIALVLWIVAIILMIVGAVVMIMDSRRIKKQI